MTVCRVVAYSFLGVTVVAVATLVGIHFVIYVIVIDWLTRNFGSKRTESEGAARGRGLFT